MENYYLIDQQLEVDAASFVIFVMHDVACPGFAPDLHDNTLLGCSELSEHNGLTVTSLVEVRVVVDGHTIRWVEFNRSHVLGITRIL